METSWKCYQKCILKFYNGKLVKANIILILDVLTYSNHEMNYYFVSVNYVIIIAWNPLKLQEVHAITHAYTILKVLNYLY